jgi:hypothetical protein
MITRLRNDKSFSNAGVPTGRAAKVGGSVLGRKKRKKRKENVRQSRRVKGTQPVEIADIEVEPIAEEVIEEPVAQMILRAQGKIRCLAFGKYRRTLYP